jgi:signal transduction histidine kinase
VAREVDQLLTLILGYTELAMQDLDVRSELLDDLRVVRGSGERARLLTDGLHTLSLRRVLHPVDLDLGPWLAGVAPMLDRGAGAAVSVQVDPTSKAQVRVDPEQLEMMLRQLVRNGAEAYEGPGIVTISVAQTPGPDGAALVAIAVEDHGRGMDAATLERCTEALFTTRPGEEASGLGLSIVAIAAGQAGGDLQVASRGGIGTTATLLLPSVADGDHGSKR